MAVPLSFDEAWQLVLKNNSGLAASQSGIIHASHLSDAAQALNLPQVTLQGSYTHLDKAVELDLMDLNPIASNKNNPLLSNPAVQQLIQGLGGSSAFVTAFTEQDLVTSSVQALWPLYAGGRIDAAQSIRQAQVDEAKQQYALKQQAAFETLTERYYGLVLARAAVGTRLSLERALAGHLLRAQKMESQGQIARVERLSAEAAYQQARTDTLAAQRQAEIAELALANLTQKSGGIEPGDGLFLHSQLPPVETFIQPMLASHPGLSLLQAKLTQADGLLTAEQGKRLPELFLFGNYALYEQDTLAAKMAPDWLVGVGVKVPLISRDGISDTTAAAAATQVQVKQLTAQLRQDLTLLTEKSWREADLAREQYQHLASTEQLAQENVRLREKAFQQGLGTSLDVEDAQSRLAAVQTQRQAVAYQYVVCLARLLALSGQSAHFSQFQTQNRIEVAS